ncbi:DUF5949 family protein [Streptomyces sp. NPDC050636]|uniref:DUF5949 family protein n=1 Tax=Streptomyces sp. NPDC050636 TaxID=3154510 RepID=UPI00344A9EA2
MAYTPGDGTLRPQATQLAMRNIVRAWGMQEGGFAENPRIKDEPVIASLKGSTVTVTGIPGLTLSRATNGEWADIARRRGQIFLSVATRVLAGGMAAPEARIMDYVQDLRTIRSAASMLVPVS